MRIGLCVAAMLAVHLAGPDQASAQWYIDGAIGGSRNQNADVSIRVPSASLALDFHDVRLLAESSRPRRYYVLRLGRQARSRALGWEVELIHLKAVADTSRSYEVTVGTGTQPPATGVSPMNLVVQEYAMTHGVNLGVVNVVLRHPLGWFGPDRAAFALRGGVGATFPHAETVINGSGVYHYEYGGPGAHGAAGLRVRIVPRVAVVTEYKFTYARPRIDVAGGGEGWTTLASHHAIVGASFDLTR